MKRLVLERETINEWIRSYINSHGIDVDKEYSTHSQWGENGVNIVFTQEDDAPLQLRKKLDDALKRAIAKRPSYLGD